MYSWPLAECMQKVLEVPNGCSLGLDSVGGHLLSKGGCYKPDLINCAASVDPVFEASTYSPPI